MLARGPLLSFATLLVIAASRCVAADNTVLILGFGAEPGAPLPHAYSYGKADVATETFTLRIPVVDRGVQTVFHDTELTVRTADNVVLHVSAARAFASLAACEEALATITAKLAEGLPRERPSGDAWQRQSADGGAVGRALCDMRRYYPMPVLRLDIAVAE